MSPDWLPIAKRPGHGKSVRVKDGVKLAAAMVGHAMPAVVGADSRSWTLGCGCGLS